MLIYIDRRDWWIGYYRGDQHHYVCVLTVVISWKRRAAKSASDVVEGQLALFDVEGTR